MSTYYHRYGIKYGDGSVNFYCHDYGHEIIRNGEPAVSTWKEIGNEYVYLSEYDVRVKITFENMIESLEKVLKGKPTKITSDFKNDLGDDENEYFIPAYFIYFENEKSNIKYIYKIQYKETFNGDIRKHGDSLYIELLEYYGLIKTRKELFTYEITEKVIKKYYIYANDEGQAEKYRKIIVGNEEEEEFKGIEYHKEYIYKEIP